MRAEAAALLAAARWAPLCVVVNRSWWVRAVLLAIAILAVAPALADVALPSSLAAALGREASVGMLCAFTFAAPFWAAHSVGLLILPRLGDLLLLFALALFASIDGPALLVRALAHSYSAFPLGVSPVPPQSMVEVGATLLLAAFTMAAPVIAVLWATDLFAGLLGQAQPALQGAIGAAPRLLVATLVLAALAVKMGSYLVHEHFARFGQLFLAR